MDFSFESSKQRMIDYLRARSSWAEILPESTDMRLVEMVADEVEEVARFDEYLVRETKWDLARNRSSLMKQVRARGYRPHRKIGARGQVAVSISKNAFAESWKWYITYPIDSVVTYQSKIWKALQSNSNQAPTGLVGDLNWAQIRTFPTALIGIPKYTELSMETGRKFTSISAMNYTTADDYVLLEVVQGVRKSLLYTATGALFEEFSIANSNIDTNHKELYVDGELWTEIDDIRKAEPGEKKYQVIDAYDFSGIRIRFGNDLAGKKLAIGQVVKFIYIETDGELGSVSTRGAITNVDSTISDIAGNTITLYACNFNAVAGGKNHETLEEIRINATKFFQSGDQLITASDYEVFLEKNFDFIGNCTVWGAYEKNLDAGNDPWDYVPTEENLVYISAYTPGDQPIDILKNLDGSDNPVYKMNLVMNIRERKPLTDIVKFVPVKFIYFSFSTKLFVQDQNYLLSEVIEKVRAALWAEYPITKMDFKRNIYETNYKRFIDEIDGVEHHNTAIKLIEFTKFQSGGTGLSYRSDFQLPLYPLKPGTVKIYVQDDYAETPTWVLAAHDDGGGAFIADTGTLDEVCTIDYSNGMTVISFNSGFAEEYPRYSLKVYYELESLDLRLSQRNQVLYLKEVDDITAEYIES